MLDSLSAAALSSRESKLGRLAKEDANRALVSARSLKRVPFRRKFGLLTAIILTKHFPDFRHAKK